jgi:hypothetical protein
LNAALHCQEEGSAGDFSIDSSLEDLHVLAGMASVVVVGASAALNLSLTVDAQCLFGSACETLNLCNHFVVSFLCEEPIGLQSVRLFRLGRVAFVARLCVLEVLDYQNLLVLGVGLDFHQINSLILADKAQEIGLSNLFAIGLMPSDWYTAKAIEAANRELVCV